LHLHPLRHCHSISSRRSPRRPASLAHPLRLARGISHGVDRTIGSGQAETGKLAYAVGEGGERRIDTSELDRVFGIRINGATPGAMAPSVQSHGTHVGEIAALQRQLDDREETIRDLRTRLDASEGERRTVQARLDAVLTDQRARRSWWPWR
jgi:hypothetical protein